MIGNLIALLVLLAIAVLFGYLVKRAWGTKRGALLKWGGVILAGLFTLVFVLVFVIGLIGFFKTTMPLGNPASNVKVQGTAEQIARGQVLALGCTGCHAPEENPALIGANDNFAQIPDGPNLGTIYPPNLTPAGEIKNWSDGEIIRAIREGVHQSGRPLLVMPTAAFHSISDPDVQAIVAYLRSLPATSHQPQNDSPSNSVNVLGLMMIGAGIFDTSAQPPITQPIPDPPLGVNAERGRYLTAAFGCQDCHGKTLTGGTLGGFTPVGPNLPLTTASWSDADIIKLFRTGTLPDGKIVSNDMPWKDYSQFSDDEYKSMLAFIKSLPKDAPK